MGKLTIAAVLAGVFAPGIAAQPEAENPFKPFDRAAFEQHMRSIGADDEAVAAFRAQLEEESAGVAADTFLRRLVTKYDEAVGQAENADPQAALSLAELISSSSDRYVRAHARYHLGRVFLDAEEPEKAVEIFAEFLNKDRNTTPLDSEVARVVMRILS